MDASIFMKFLNWIKLHMDESEICEEKNYNIGYYVSSLC